MHLDATSKDLEHLFELLKKGFYISKIQIHVEKKDKDQFLENVKVTLSNDSEIVIESSDPSFVTMYIIYMRFLIPTAKHPLSCTLKTQTNILRYKRNFSQFFLVRFQNFWLNADQLNRSFKIKVTK